MEQKKENRGGARVGAGRKKGSVRPGETNRPNALTIRLTDEAFNTLSRVARGSRSRFIEAAIFEKAERDGI